MFSFLKPKKPSPVPIVLDTPTDVQDVLNKVIASGWYVVEYGMCLALHRASEAGVITSKEAVDTQIEVSKYVRSLSPNHPYLRNSLKELGMSSGIDSCLRIYRNWSERPRNTNEKSNP